MRWSNAFEIVGDVAHIDVSTRSHPVVRALVDAVELEAVCDGSGRWRAGRCGTDGYYVWRNGPRPAREYILLHRHLLGLRKGDGRLVDHVNGSGLDNRRENLRLATVAENNANRRPKRVRTQYKGIWPQPYGRWRAHIGIDGKQIYLGTFDAETDAARAYDAAAREAFGEFAFLNFPEGVPS